MDYSMLVGLHFKETTSAGTVTPSRISSAGGFTPTGTEDGRHADNLLSDPSRYIVNNFIFAEVSIS